MCGIDITGIDRSLLFMNLYKSARRQKGHCFSFSRENTICIRDARKYVGKYVSTLNKKVMEIRVPSKLQENKLYAEKYNNANGKGLAEKVVRKIRKSTPIEETAMKSEKKGVEGSKSCCSCKCCTRCCSRGCKCLSNCCGCLGGFCGCLSSLRCCKCCECKCSKSLKTRRGKGKRSKEKSSKKNNKRENPKKTRDADRKNHKGNNRTPRNPMKNIRDAAISTASSAASAGVSSGVGAGVGSGVGTALGAGVGAALGAGAGAALSAGVSAGTGCMSAAAGCLGGTAGSCLGGLLAGGGTYGGCLAAGAGAGSIAAITAGSGAGLLGFTAVGLTICLCPGCCCCMARCIGDTLSTCASGCCSCVILLANIGSSFLSCFSCICNVSNLCCTCLCKSCNRCCFPSKKVTVVKNVVVRR